MRTCTECDATVILTDNNVWLDSEPSIDGEWHIMVVGPMSLAAAGGPEVTGREQFHLHEHQPAERVTS